MELSSTAYDQLWRFDMEALPADLIRRGMAIEDPTAEHGLKLTIEDYPFANDAVNYGQYMYGGYFPNRPTIARSNMPTEDANEERFKMFLKKPEAALLRCFPSQVQATTVMVVLDVLSNHSPDEEYIGENVVSPWAEDPVIKAAFERFNGSLKKLEGIIDERNTNLNLKNRVGAGVVPYELLKPFSESGVTGKGVPNSISI
ncbi:hypothetical protein M0R45_033973 [Rubus argutus]|uniref:Lipoxygenase domain-containing protein n=1 Tax=Rubus argutus TaxID=59490 RepID=A0AAW1VSF5_RUBAR